MASSARISAALQLLIDGTVEEELSLAATTLAVTGRDYIKRSQIIGSSAEALDVGELGTCGLAFFYHTGKDGSGVAVADTINLRTGSGGADLAKLKPGEVAMFRLAANTPHAIASSTGSPELRYLILED